MITYAVKMDPHEVRDSSWTGDAVLALLAREWIIAHERDLATPRHDLFRDLTSNHFLASFGPPTEVEAHLGRIYHQQGLEAARTWFDETLIPVFQRQQRNRRTSRR